MNYATEIAYKNGYTAALRDILEHYNKHELTIPQLVEHIATLKGLHV